MRLITRYVLGEVGIVFALSLTGLTALMLLVGAVQEAIRQGLGLEQVIRLLPYLIPNALLFAVPGTVLLAVTLVFSRMSSSGEITALKAAGINPLAVLWPIFILSTLMSLGEVWLNDLAVSWGYRGVQQVVLTSVEDILFGVLRTQKSYSTRQFSITVKAVDERQLINPTITFQPNGDMPPVTISAEQAEIRSDMEKNLLIFTFRNGLLDYGGRVSFEFPEYEQPVSLDEASRRGGGGTVSASHVALHDIPKRIAETKLAIKQGEAAVAAEAAWRLLTGDLARLTSPPQSGIAQNLSGARDELSRLQTEPPRRWAAGFSCFCFVIVGAPLAILGRGRDALTSFFLCFFPILVAYYPLMMWGVNRAKAGDWDPSTVWLANLVCLLAGLWLTRRVWRY